MLERATERRAPPLRFDLDLKVPLAAVGMPNFDAARIRPHRRQYFRLQAFREVGHLKEQHNIEPVLQDRVDQVRERCADRAAAKSGDGDFVRELYARIIAYSCGLEEDIRSERKTG